MEFVLFILFAGMTLTGAILMVALHNLVRAVLAMILGFVGLAGLYLLLEAEFLAAIQVLIYVGAVAILVLFAVMLTQRVSDPNAPVNNNQAWLGFTVALGFFGMLSAVFAPLKWPSLPEQSVSTVENLGKQLIGPYAVPFEAASVVLLVALLGAIILARE
ncbi:MAG: NADH-quinone oxidoreductase subunit J [Chloroflexi bacterium]|nr:NADH-quinone oxidoreductase subunit J [Chloroflexota bacterium]